jgi:hypothetical protein
MLKQQPTLFETAREPVCMHGVISFSGCPRCAWWQDAETTDEETQAPWAECLEARYLRETA